MCGRPTGADGAKGGVDLEVFTDAGVNYGSFCGQEHAAEWLSRPLPAPVGSREYKPTIGDRVFTVAAVAVLAYLAVMVVVGCVTSALWVSGRITG